jgi:plasmid stabilization system protein ParE
MAAPDILATMPSFGAVVEEFGVDHIREFGVGPYRVTYAVEGDVCTIAAVIHARQDLTNTLDANDFQP